MGVFDDTIRYLDQLGVADVFLPFFLIFAIVFAILQRAHIFGKDANKSRRFDVIVALVMGAAVVFTHVLRPNSPFDVVPILNNAFPQVGLVLVAIVMVLLLLGVLGAKFSGKGDYSGIVLIASIATIGYIFIGASGRFWNLPTWINNSQTIAIVITLLVFGLVIWFITRDDTPKEGDKSFLERLDSHMKKVDGDE